MIVWRERESEREREQNAAFRSPVLYFTQILKARKWGEGKYLFVVTSYIQVLESGNSQTCYLFALVNIIIYFCIKYALYNKKELEFHKTINYLLKGSYNSQFILQISL
jgi:hypothetical protein